MKMKQKYIATIAAMGLCLSVTLGVACGGGGFLGLADFQRDLIVGGLLGGVLLNQPPAAEVAAGNPVPGVTGEQGVPGLDGIDGVEGPAGSEGMAGEDGPQGEEGPAGPAGPNGSSGSAGPQGEDGADGQEFFSIFIDDFFTTPQGGFGDLPVQVVDITEPVLGNFEGDGIAYRVAIPNVYHAGNDVTMRMTFLRQGLPDNECFIFSVSAARLRAGESMATYGDPLFLAIQNSFGEFAGRPGTSNELFVIDLPINVTPGLVDDTPLAVSDVLAFELSTELEDFAPYQILSVEFFESNNATLAGADIVDEVCCNNQTPTAGPFAYISNTASDDVWVVDILRREVVAVVDVDDDPRGIDISPDNSRVYVANRRGGSVSVIDTATNALTQNIVFSTSDIVTATEPYDVVVSADGEWLYVAMKNGGSENGDGTVVVVDLPAGDIVAEVVLDGDASLEGIVVTPDGRKVYAAGRGDMYAVDVSTTTTPTFLNANGDASRELVVSPDGAWVYADDGALNTGDDTSIITGDSSGERGITISPNGQFLYSTNENSSVRVVEISMFEGFPVTNFVADIDDMVNRQFGAYGIDLMDSGDLGVVSFRASDSVRIFDTSTLSFVGTPISMRFTTCDGETRFGDEPKQLVISHTVE